MKRVFTILIAVAALGSAGWFGIHALGGSEPLASVAIPVKAAENLPDTPAAPGARVRPLTLSGGAWFSTTGAGAWGGAPAADGTVDLDRPITNWRTSLRLPEGAEARVTLDDLLAQRTGLTRHAYDEKLEEGRDPALLRASLATAPLQCEPGTCYTYQNVAFDAASEILGEAANEIFADVVENRFFRPLGMISAGYGMARLTGAKDWAKPHRGAHVHPVKEAYWRVPAAAGVESDIVDFATWMQAMMGSRPDVLPAPALQLAHRPRVGTGRLYGGPLRQATSDASYGLGWRSFTYAGRRLEGHSGAVEGYRATMIFEPATRTGVVAMWNSDWGFPFRIPFAAIDSYHQRADARWLDLGELPPVTSARTAAKAIVEPPKG